MTPELRRLVLKMIVDRLGDSDFRADIDEAVNDSPEVQAASDEEGAEALEYVTEVLDNLQTYLSEIWFDPSNYPTVNLGSHKP